VNIRGVSNITIPDSVSKKERTSDPSSPDKDPNSGGHGGDQEKRQKYSAEEIEQIVKNIKKLSGFEKNNLKVTIDQSRAADVICIVDHTGKIVRRLAGPDLTHLLKVADDNKGNILDKAM
jgi:uncharacterized FlaG/YvyC family protein